MSEKPQEDILDEIMGRDPAYSGEDPGGPEEPAPAETAPPAEAENPPGASAGRNRRSSVYIYLFILFAAAFLMLLLAYFIQLRNSETTISDLRDSMNLSREELMDQIDALKEENDALQKDNDLHEYEADQARGLYEEKRQEALKLNAENGVLRSQLSSAIILGYLERFCHGQDYLMAAVVVEEQDQWFNEKNPSYFKADDDIPTQTARYLELREEVFDKGECMALEERYTAEDGSGAAQRPYIAGRYDKDTVQTARSLWEIIYFYSERSFETAAWLIAAFSADSAHMEQLNGGQFQPSTLALYEQIKADLAEQGRLELDEDGAVVRHIEPDWGSAVTGSIAIADIDADSGRYYPSIPEQGSADVSRETSQPD